MQVKASHYDMSERMTLSPGCKPLRISMEFTDARPSITCMRLATLPSSSSLKIPTVVLGWPKAGARHRLRRQDFQFRWCLPRSGRGAHLWGAYHPGDVDGHGSVLHRGVNPHHVAGDNAVACVDRN